MFGLQEIGAYHLFEYLLSKTTPTLGVVEGTMTWIPLFLAVIGMAFDGSSVSSKLDDVRAQACTYLQARIPNGLSTPVIDA